MPRIAGIDIPKEKPSWISLSFIYGIGRSSAMKILQAAGVDPVRRAKDLNEHEVSKITSIIQRDYKVEGDLRREVTQNVKRLMDIGSYRGLRHKKGLPVRGQRTSTNARTRKGPKRLMGVRKKTASAPAAPAAGKP